MSAHNDLFAVLPTEIWLAIISFLSPEAYLALKLTSSHMRRVINANAGRIANDGILSLYPQEAAILQSTLVDGWLVPTHECVRVEEERIKFRNASKPPRSIVITKLSEPGPQYLRFLTEYSLHIRVYHDLYGPRTDYRARQAAMESDTAALNSVALVNQPERFTESVAVYCVRKFLTRLNRIAKGNGIGLETTINEETSIKCMEDSMAWFYD